MKSVDNTYPGYFDNSNHKQPDYTKPYQHLLPGADFNKAVQEFQEDDAIFN